MERWNVRFIIYKRGESFEAECLDASAVGVGDSPLDAMDDLVAMLNTMAVLAHNSGASLTVEIDPEDLDLYRKLESGKVSDDIAGYGHLSFAMHVRDNTNEARLEKMDLVAGPA